MRGGVKRVLALDTASTCSTVNRLGCRTQHALVVGPFCLLTRPMGGITADMLTLPCYPQISVRSLALQS